LWGDLGDLHRKTKEQTLVKTIVVLIRNTTWRCGKLEKSIVRHLHKRHESFSNKDMSVGDIMQNLNLAGEKKGEFLDALKRLEKRNIVKLMPLRR
jgi:transcription initiation factor TFIIIB Brf1 subunit/transcription initiation factor TFIIB